MKLQFKCTFQVANGLVRTNAVGILIDAFPLVNPESSNEQMDTLLQKQFDALLVCFFLVCKRVRI